MPPKRRKEVESSDAPEPKRRVTRSSMKKVENADATSPSTSSKQTSITKTVKSKTSKSGASKNKNSEYGDISTKWTSTTSKRPSSTSSSKAKATNINEPAANGSENASHPTDLTITHDSLKNPMNCQEWGANATSSKAPDSTSSTLIFTHGAGGTLSAPAVLNFCTGYSDSGSVLAFQGSMNLGARVKGFSACLAHLEGDEKTKESKNENEGSAVLGGRSMGARAAVIAASELLSTPSSQQQQPVDLILVSYPLQGPKDVRDQILLDLPEHVKVLFVIGDRDSMCPLNLLDEVRKKMKAKSWLVVVQGADHGMHGGGREKETALGVETGRMAAKWVVGERDGKDESIWWDEGEGMVKRGER